MKKKRLFSLLFLFFSTISLSSCIDPLATILINLDRSSVEEFGDISFLKINNISNKSRIKSPNKIYYYVGDLENNIEEKTAIGAFNDDNHGHILYSLNDEKYEGIYILHYVTPYSNDTEWIYIDDNCNEIPCSLIKNMPHINNTIGADTNFNLNEKTYNFYNYCYSSNLNKEEIIGNLDSNDYYKINGYTNWIFSQYEEDDNIFKIYYEISIESLPSYFVFLTNPYNKSW